MDRMKAKAFLQEFPALNDLFGRDALGALTSLDFCKVERLQEGLLLDVHEIQEVNGSMVGIYMGEEAYAHFPSAGWVGAKSAHDYKSNYAYDDPYTSEGENLLAVIDRIGETPDLAAVRVYGLRVVNHHTRGEGLIIYKVPKGMDIDDIVRKAQEKALELVRAEASF